MRLSDRGRRLLVGGVAVIGYVLAVSIMIRQGIEGAGGAGGIDAIAYWSAAGHAWRGEPLYGLADFTFAAYQYPPPFAQLLAPLSILPMTVFVWGWRALELACLRVAVGSWRRAGVALLVWPPIIAELDAGNIHLVMAATAALAMRGAAGLVGPTFFLKFASWPLLPTAVLRDGRRALVGIAIALGCVVLSWLLSPTAWSDYVAFLQTARSPIEDYNVLSWFPLPARIAIAGLLGLAAIRYVRLAPLAVLLAYPVVWLHGLSTLSAVVAPLGRRRPAVIPD